MDFDLTQTDNLLTTTRAVRKRLDLTRPVPRELVLDCVRVSTQAPAGRNYQKWRWVIVDDPDKKAVIADAYQRSYAPYIAKQREAVARAARPLGLLINASAPRRLRAVMHLDVRTDDVDRAADLLAQAIQTTSKE